MTERLLTAREVGEWLGLSTESVLRRYRRGERPGVRIARAKLAGAEPASPSPRRADVYARELREVAVELGSRYGR